MTKYSLDCSHVDTCLPDYVTDHCNGAAEMLIGVPVDGSTRHWQLKAELLAEVNAYGDKLPDDMPDAQIEAAVARIFKGAHPLRLFDVTLPPADDYGESCYAWFRFDWSPVGEG